MLSRYILSQARLEKLQDERVSAFKALLTTAAKNTTKIIYLDETLFKVHNIKGKSWAPEGKYQHLDKIGHTAKTQAAIICISAQRGLEAYLINEFSIKKKEIVQVLEQLRNNNKYQRLVVFLDNLRSHHSQEVQRAAKKLRIQLLYNASYSSEYHCIEWVFAQMKREYRRRVLG